MLAPLIIELLIASLLFLLGGWIIDTVHASTHVGPVYLHFVGWLPPSEKRPSDHGTGASGTIGRDGH